MGKNYIITGAAGAGKTTLINQLRQIGFLCCEEVSRRMIMEQKLQKTDALPWKNMAKFCTLVFNQTIAQHKKNLNSSEVCFFDRGIPDIIANLRYKKINPPSKYFNAINQMDYQKDVIVLPPERSIYVNDNERTESFETANEIYFQIVDVYKSLGFRLHKVEFLPVANRANKVIDLLGINTQRISK
ncbi:MAG: AAA family ATPase [Bacteroidales bacterium]|nr:AAA family ATPase [Bacteroidales bacterium]